MARLPTPNSSVPERTPGAGELTCPKTHEQLCTDLAEYLDSAGEYVANQVSYGSRWLTPHTQIPDVMRIRMSYTRVDIAIYEVKVSRSDFQGDLREGKYLGYLPMCSRLYFATPAEGVVKSKVEIPEGVGWIVRVGHGWHVRQAPKIRPVELNPYGCLALLMDVAQSRRRLLRELDAIKKSKHRHNVFANEKMQRRIRRVESKIEDAWRYRKELVEIKTEFLKALNLTDAELGWRNNWVDRALRAISGGRPEADNLRELVGALDTVIANASSAKNFISGMLPPDK